MKWIDDLPEFSRRRAKHFMKAREYALRDWNAGLMPKELAQLIISKCNREIEQIAEVRTA